MSFDNDFSFDVSDFSASRVTASDGCTLCGVCVTACPTYRVTQDIEQSPMGRIRIMRTLATNEVKEITLEKLDSCLLCKTCETICPSKVAYSTLYDNTTSSKSLSSIGLRLLLIFSKNRLLRKLLIPLFNSVRKSGLLSILRSTKILALMNKQWIVNSFDHRKLSQRDIAYVSSQDSRNMQFSLFEGCISSLLEPSLLSSTRFVLSSFGIVTRVPKDQSCCGALHRHNGFKQTACDLAEQNINAFSCKTSERIVTMATGCHQSLMDYPRWLNESNSSHNSTSVRHFTDRVVDINTLLDEIQWPDNIFLVGIPRKVYVHTPCSAQSHDIHWLNRIPNITFYIPERQASCCGAGGSHQFTHYALAKSIREETLDLLVKANADILLTTNTGCAAHLRDGIAQRNITCEVMHPIELLAKIITKTKS